MTLKPADPSQPPVYGLDHSAYRCRDAEETRAFYEDVLGFPMTLALHIDRHPTTGEPVNYLHIFFDIGSGDPERPTHIAFFDVVDNPGDDPDELFKRRWGMDLHFAMRVGDHVILGHWDGAQLRPGSSLHPGDMKIIKSAKLVDFELYNLRDDLGEKQNLAAQSPELLEKLSQMLRRKYAEVQQEGFSWQVPRRR